ncbi:GH1 family beta-glucosidase [Shimia ponticola]|uniref:GH1 family beta-glucosidase n=1 Tax=Shimia ponticola TaxID=2582893 RepID=UPI0011BD52A5|nr:GH1 family beta-glucosidase [Shimia ponticola]
MPVTRKDFPKDFLFGAATAAYQIEGHSFGGAGSTHWDTYAATPGNVIRAEDGAIACDHYHRYEEDLDFLKDGGFDTYRFSTSWARVLPEGRGQVNEAGLDYYDRLVDAMLARDLKPNQTLYHWEMPSALADLGGWEHPDVADWFADYVEVITKRIGDRVSKIATINEPWCVSVLGHFIGRHAPGKVDVRSAARAVHHVLKAHGRGMTRLREMGQKDLGIVVNYEAVKPGSDDPRDVAAANRQHAIMNQLFMHPLFKGEYTADAMEGYGPHLPKGWQDDMAEISQPMDWHGVNYYMLNRFAHDDTIPWPSLKQVEGPLPKTQMGWEIYPDGLSWLLTWLKDEYVGDLPMFITENGMAWPEADTGSNFGDTERWKYIQDHLAAVRQSMIDGANIEGFYYWSLLDNYEWAFGYEKRFGLIHVDFDSLKRTPKHSYYALTEWLRATD